MRLLFALHATLRRKSRRIVVGRSAREHAQHSIISRLDRIADFARITSTRSFRMAKASASGYLRLRSAGHRGATTGAVRMLSDDRSSDPRVKAQTAVPVCGSCGRKRLAKTLNCVFCGAWMPEPLQHDSILKSSAAPRRKARVSRKSPPSWSKVDRVAGSDGSDEMAAVVAMKPGIVQFETPRHQWDLVRFQINGEPIHLRRCAWCDEVTHSLKAFNLPKFLIIPVSHFHYHMYETEPTEACPRCMRTILLKYLACQIITANILWPILVLPIYAFYFVLTFRKGFRGQHHS
jgi:hypothetical protein